MASVVEVFQNKIKIIIYEKILKKCKNGNLNERRRFPNF